MFWYGVFSEVSDYVISSLFRLINLHPIWRQQIHKDFICYDKYSTAGHAMHNAAVLYIDTSEFARFLPSSVSAQISFTYGLMLFAISIRSLRYNTRH